MKPIICLFFFLSFINAQAQWEIGLPNGETLDIQWQERDNSWQNEGIHTFVGYYQKLFVATLVVYPDQKASGSLQWEGSAYQLTGTLQGKLLAKLRFLHNPNNKCGTDTHRHTYSPFYPQNSATARPITNSSSVMPNDPEGILHFYRLAVLIDYYDFAHTFGSNMAQVRDFLLNLETFLNEVYVRDIGVKFSIVADDRLIIQEVSKQLYNQMSRRDIIENSTEKINELIGDNQYDIGIVIALGTDSTLSGLAFFSGGFRLVRKGGASAIAENATIAHEIGHLFGADHTFKNVYSGNSLYTEPAYGQSLMGYSNNFPDGAFFSLPTAYQIRSGLVNRSYFKNPERTLLVDRNGNDTSNFNYAYGIKTESSFPTIDRTKLQESYTIPKDTYFQFYIKATNTNNTPIYYTAQLTSKAGKNDPKFLTRKGKTSKEPITFQTQYNDLGGFINYTRPNAKGEHLFWLAASNPAPEHFVNYDMVTVKVNMVDGKTFAITNGMNDEYEGGAQLTLNWQVDSNLFDADSKVRILLSDDFGKTFKYTLVESTENDGSCEITLPNIEIGTVGWGKQKKIQLRAGVIKVEVIDHIAFAITNVAPYKTSNGKLVPNGGFAIKKKKEPLPPLTFVEDSKPKHITVQCAGDIPMATYPTTKGGCGVVSITYSDKKLTETCANNFTIERIFTAHDGCETITYRQNIVVNDTQKPTYIGILPEDKIIDEGAMLIEQTLTATDNCKGTFEVVPTKEILSNKIIYTWVAKDDCGNELLHKQTITVRPIPKEPQQEPEKSVVIYNGVSAENPHNYFTIQGADSNSPIHLLIFDEMGLKVYENEHYGKNGDWFRGYANAKNFISNNKALHGTYFYIVRYSKNGKIEKQKGFLYVR